MLSCLLMVNFTEVKELTHSANITIPVKYIWIERSVTEFQEALQRPNIASKIDTFVNNTYCLSNLVSIDKAVTDFNFCIFEAANTALRVKVNKKSKKERPDKPWFNTHLHNIKTSLDHCSTLLAFNPFSRELRSKCFSLIKNYNKIRREMCRNFYKKLLDKITSIPQSNPKAFWDIINSLKRKVITSILRIMNGLTTLGN